MPLLALIDYDNVAQEQEFGPDDVERNLNAIANNTIKLCAQAGLLSERELRLRLYGGWVTERGEYSKRGELLLARISTLRGLRMGIRVLPAMVTSVLNCEDVRLIGSYRPQRDFATQKTRYVQKMVDSMLAVDIVLLSQEPNTQFVVVCDDDDVVPALIAAQRRTSKPSRVFRRRQVGQGLNDSILVLAGCQLENFFKS